MSSMSIKIILDCFVLAVGGEYNPVLGGNVTNYTFYGMQAFARQSDSL
jgi:hypothetical protein